MIAVEPKAELGEMFDAAGGAGKPRVGQMPISFGTDKAAAVTRAHTLFRWFGLGWKVNAELPGPPAFDAASQFVREEDVAERIPCGDDVDAVLEAAKEYADAGFTHLALVQIGGDQQEPFLEWSREDADAGLAGRLRRLTRRTCARSLGVRSPATGDARRPRARDHRPHDRGPGRAPPAPAGLRGRRRADRPRLRPGRRRPADRRRVVLPPCRRPG